MFQFFLFKYIFFIFIVCMTNFQQYDEAIVAAAFLQQVASHTNY